MKEKGTSLFLLSFIFILSSVQAVDYSVELEDGWNTISSHTNGIGKAEINDQCNWKGGPWRWSKSKSDWMFREEMSPMKGYWVKVKGSCTLDIEGPPAPPENLKLSKGWNLVSSVNGKIGKPNIQDQCDWEGGPWYWSKESEDWVFEEYMQPDNGYWVKVKDSCEVDYQAKKSKSPIESDEGTGTSGAVDSQKFYLDNEEKTGVDRNEFNQLSMYSLDEDESFFDAAVVSEDVSDNPIQRTMKILVGNQVVYEGVCDARVCKVPISYFEGYDEQGIEIPEGESKKIFLRVYEGSSTSNSDEINFVRFEVKNPEPTVRWIKSADDVKNIYFRNASESSEGEAIMSLDSQSFTYYPGDVINGSFTVSRKDNPDGDGYLKAIIVVDKVDNDAYVQRNSGTERILPSSEEYKKFSEDSQLNFYRLEDDGETTYDVEVRNQEGTVLKKQFTFIRESYDSGRLTRN